MWTSKEKRVSQGQAYVFEGKGQRDWQGDILGEVLEGVGDMSRGRGVWEGKCNHLPLFKSSEMVRSGSHFEGEGGSLQLRTSRTANDVAC